MKKIMFLPAVIIASLAVINAVIDSKRKCGCQPECWCQHSVLRHSLGTACWSQGRSTWWKHERESGLDA
jgi:hypothetical protein